MFESVVPLLNLCDAHGIAADNLLNLPNGFHLAVANLLAKSDAIPLLESFRHFRKMRCALCIHSHSHGGCTWLTMSAGGKKSTYVHEGTFHLSTTEHLLCLISFRGKKSCQILFEQPTYAATVQHIFLHITISTVRYTTWFNMNPQRCTL
jgi:hypothetical protein